uniref:Uncharacterized protein n=1 Tax=Rhizophora mucronata TaxID=61149 RepID=A0A2P2PAD2_RHIMU
MFFRCDHFVPIVVSFAKGPDVGNFYNLSHILFLVNQCKIFRKMIGDNLQRISQQL